MTDIETKVVMRQGTEKDAIQLSDLGARLFHDTYVGKINSEFLDPYVDTNFSPNSQRAELLDQNIKTVLVEIQNTLVGYAQLRLSPIPVTTGDEISVELSRIYVDKSVHGLGIGRQLLQKVGQLSTEMHHNKIWLGVWEENATAIAFYTKLGFNRVGDKEFRMGTEIQNDFVLVGETNRLM